MRDPQLAIAPEQLDAMGKITNITHDGDNIIIRVEAVVDENLKDGIMTLDLKPDGRTYPVKANGFSVTIIEMNN